MIQKDRFNLRGAINSLGVGECLKVSRDERSPSNIRNTAYLLKLSTAKDFTVNVEPEVTIVTRIQ